MSSQKVYICWRRYWDDSVEVYYIAKNAINAEARSMRQRSDVTIRETGYYVGSVGSPVEHKDKVIVYTSALGAG